MTRPPAFQETIAPPPLAWAVLAGLLLLPIGFMSAVLARDPRAASVLVPAMVFVLALVAVLVWPCRLRLDSRGLHLRHGLFRHTVAAADLDPNYFTKEGFGALVARFGQGVPVHLSTPVKRMACDIALKRRSLERRQSRESATRLPPMRRMKVP